MSILNLQTLDDAGMSFEQVGLQARRKSANFGDGYTASARFGDPRGLRAWRVRIDLLPDFSVDACAQTYLDTRARYLWNFWKLHKLERSSEIFIMRDPFPDDPTRTLARVFARFKDEELSYALDTEYLFQTGLTLLEARVPGYVSANDYNAQEI